MSVRVAYLARSGRGVALRRVRLVGSNSDQWWPAEPGPAGDGGASVTDLEGRPEDINAAAGWITERLADGRGDRQLAQVVLDCSGGVCSWLSTPSSSTEVVGAVARSSGASGGFGAETDRGAGPSALAFFAGSSLDSSVQALAAVIEGREGGNGAVASGPMRLPVMAMTDVPARLLVDALDARGVAVDGVCSLWHAMARVWDPQGGTSRREGPADPLRATVEHVLAIVLVDPSSGRLIWTWSRGGTDRAGQLLVAGSMRLRTHRPQLVEAAAGEADGTNEASAPPLGDVVAIFGADDAARLANEWLSWAAQVGKSPERIVCVVPDVTPGTIPATDAGDEQIGPAALGEALSKAWPGATVTAAVHNDPIEATLRKLCDALEQSPKAEGLDDPGRTLLDVTRRPRRMHRSMHLWAATAIAAGAVFVVVVGMRLRAAAHDAAVKTDAWRSGWKEKVRTLHPDAFAQEKVGISPVEAMNDAIKKLEDQLAPIERTDAANYVLPELETISMVVGNQGLSLVSLDLDAQRSPHAKLVASSPDLKAAEALLEALNHIAGSHLGTWTANYVTEATGNNETRYRGTYTARWSTGTPPAGTSPATKPTKPATGGST